MIVRLHPQPADVISVALKTKILERDPAVLCKSKYWNLFNPFSLKNRNFSKICLSYANRSKILTLVMIPKSGSYSVCKTFWIWTSHHMTKPMWLCRQNACCLPPPPPTHTHIDALRPYNEQWKRSQKLQREGGLKKKNPIRLKSALDFHYPV